MIFAYARISTNKSTQKTDRQLFALHEYATANGFTIDEVVEETESGKSLDRSKYQALCQRMRRGDILLITDIDRLGRNADGVIMEFKRLKQAGIKVVALDTPYLNQWRITGDDSLYSMVVDILITLKAHLAEQERAKLINRINQGLDVARANGKRLGRPPKTVNSEIVKLHRRVGDGEITITEAAKIAGISRQHFYRLCKQI
jgi:DNA invertase Pin-like site-specific DNA recombinase